jgi:5,10-methylenetetrahydrofolate reductase
MQPIQNYNSFKKFTSWCKTSVPSHITAALERIKVRKKERKKERKALRHRSLAT